MSESRSQVVATITTLEKNADFWLGIQGWAPLFQQTRLQLLCFYKAKFFETWHMWSSPPNATLDERFFQNSPYFRFYGLVPVSACFPNISLHNWPIKAWDSSNWSLGPNKGFLFCKLGVGVTWGYLGSLGVKIQTFSNLDNLYIKMKLLVTWLRKSCYQGHLTPNWGVFGVIWGQNPNIFKPRYIICQNDALDPVIKKKWFSRSSEVIRPQNWGYLGSFGVKVQSF